MKCSLFSGSVHWSGSRAGLNGRAVCVCVSYFLKLLLVVDGT
jgi:hypothetical protein